MAAGGDLLHICLAAHRQVGGKGGFAVRSYGYGFQQPSGGDHTAVCRGHGFCGVKTKGHAADLVRAGNAKDFILCHDLCEINGCFLPFVIEARSRFGHLHKLPSIGQLHRAYLTG